MLVPCRYQPPTMFHQKYTHFALSKVCRKAIERRPTSAQNEFLLKKNRKQTNKWTKSVDCYCLVLASGTRGSVGPTPCHTDRNRHSYGIYFVTHFDIIATAIRGKCGIIRQVFFLKKKNTTLREAQMSITGFTFWIAVCLVNNIVHSTTYNSNNIPGQLLVVG